MATREQITAWVNPNAWENQAEAERIIDAIEASGSDSKAEWVRIASGPEAAILDAAAADYEQATRAANEALDKLKAAARAAHAAGIPEVRIIAAVPASKMTVRKWLGK